jgi:hypothetical protein
MIKKVKGGYKVTDGEKFFSNKPLTKEMASKQKNAISIPVARMIARPLKTTFSFA